MVRASELLWLCRQCSACGPGCFIVLTPDRSYSHWGDILADQVLAAAILDRLPHRSTTISIRGRSYRLREKRKAGVSSEFARPSKEED